MLILILLKTGVTQAASSLCSWFFHPEVRMVDCLETSQHPWAEPHISREEWKITPLLHFSSILIVAFCIQSIARLYMLTPSFSSKLLNNCAHPAGKRAAATPALSFFIIFISSTANYLNTELPPSSATRRQWAPVSPFAVAGDPCFFSMTVCVCRRMRQGWFKACPPA